jgi:dolichyl-phosphate beta-glucosyltransferase
MTYLPTNSPAFDNATPVDAGIVETMIVVPCYNEEARLNGEAFLKTLADNPHLSFVFVNDGSADRTHERLLSLQLAMPQQVEVISLRQNSGKAEAVRVGLQYASRMGAEMIGYWDADLATPLNAIADFETVMERYSDINVVYGARRQMLGHRINRTIKRRTVSRICAGLGRLAVGLPIGDTQCGAKLLRNTSSLRAAVAEPFTAGWLFDVELFTRIASATKKSKHGFYEMPLAEWEEIAGSKVSGRAILRSGMQMLRLIGRRYALILTQKANARVQTANLDAA